MFHLRYSKFLVGNIRFYGGGLFLRAYLYLFRALSFQCRGEGLSRGELKNDIDNPVLFPDETLDLGFPVADEAQRHRLHPARRESIAYPLPKKGTDLVSDEAVENPSCLLGVVFCRVELDGRPHGIEDSLFGYLVEEDAFNVVVLSYDLCHVKGNGFSFAVRVGPDQDSFRVFPCFFYLIHHLGFALQDVKMGLESLFDIDTKGAFWKVFYVAIRCFDDEILAQVF